MRLFIPIILVIAAVGLFALYTNPAYQGTKGLQSQVTALDDALSKAKELKSRRDELLSKRKTFSTENIQKLERLLPDNVDNIRFVIEINNIAARHDLSLQNVSLGAISDAKTTRSKLSVGPSGDAIGSVEIGFSLTATYDDFLIFLQDLEHSLRIVDVENISFQSKDTLKDTYEFSLTIRTYWLH
jgi:Tfp pilus assembly protein PilO